MEIGSIIVEMKDQEAPRYFPDWLSFVKWLATEYQVEIKIIVR